jgi:SAM-dependent methyltransferase
MQRLSDDYFAEKYAADADPWGFDTRWYEHRKHDLTVAALPRARYRSAFEPGCANGALTARLAGRCDRLLAGDLLDDVVTRAAGRLAGHPAVEVRRMALPEDWPLDERFDLVVLSEVAYYLTADGLDEALDALDASLEPGGHLVAVHWLGETDYPLRGDEVHARLRRRPSLARVCSYREDAFLLDVLERT